MTIGSITLVMGRRIPFRALHELFKRFRTRQLSDPAQGRISAGDLAQKVPIRDSDMSDTDLKLNISAVSAVEAHVADEDEMQEEMHEWLQSAPLLKLLGVHLTRDKRPKKQQYARLNGPYGYRDMNPYYLRFYQMTHDTDDGIESYVLGIESTTLNEVPGGLQLQKSVILSDTHDFYYLIDRFFRDYLPARRLAIIGSALETTIPVPPLVDIIVEYSNEAWLTELASMFLTVQTDHTPKIYKSTATSDTRLFAIQDDCICCS